MWHNVAAAELFSGRILVGVGEAGVQTVGVVRGRGRRPKCEKDPCWAKVRSNLRDSGCVRVGWHGEHVRLGGCFFMGHV